MGVLNTAKFNDIILWISKGRIVLNALFLDILAKQDIANQTGKNLNGLAMVTFCPRKCTFLPTPHFTYKNNSRPGQSQWLLYKQGHHSQFSLFGN